jgi:hypothetical protein
LLLLGAGMLLVGFNVPAVYGLVGMSAVWLVVPPLMLLWQAHYLRRFADLGVRNLILASRAPLVAVSFLVLAVVAGRHLLGISNPALQLAIVVTMSVLACMELLRRERRHLAPAA